MNPLKSHPIKPSGSIAFRIDREEDLQLLRGLISPIIGETCWLAGMTYGDELALHIGARISYKIKKLGERQRGEWILGTRASYWELRFQTKIITFSDLSVEEIEPALKIIEGRKIQNFTIQYPSLKTIFSFDNQHDLIIFPDDKFPELARWELFAPADRIVKLESKSCWSYARSDMFLSDDSFDSIDISKNLERVSQDFLTVESVRLFLSRESGLLQKNFEERSCKDLERLIDKLEKICYRLRKGLDSIRGDRENIADKSDYASIFKTSIYPEFNSFVESLLENQYHSVDSVLDGFIDTFAIDLQKYRLDASVFQPVLQEYDRSLNSIAPKNRTIVSDRKLITEVLEKEKLSLEDFVKLAKITDTMIERGIFLEENSVSLEDYRIFIQHLSIALALSVTIARETIALFTPETVPTASDRIPTPDGCQES